MMSFFQIIRYQLRNLGRFDGRDGPARFLPWGQAVIQGTSFAMILGVLPAVFPIDRAGADADGQWRWMLSTGLVLLAISGGAVLMSASIARRLNDTGRGLIWAVVPFALLLIVAAQLPYTFARLLADPEAPDLFFSLSVQVAVYLVSLGPLIVFLLAPGSPGPNRHGPEPDVATGRPD